MVSHAVFSAMYTTSRNLETEYFRFHDNKLQKEMSSELDKSVFTCFNVCISYTTTGTCKQLDNIGHFNIFEVAISL
jgi:hypothetical protein